MAAHERSPLLEANDRRLSKLIQQDEAASSIIKSHVTVEEQKMADSSVGERLAYNDYTTIDWLHDLVNRLGLPCPPMSADVALRSKTRTGYVLSTIGKVYDTSLSASLTKLQAGLPQRS